MIHTDEYPGDFPILDLEQELAAVRGGRDKLIDLFVHERDRRLFLASTIVFKPEGGIERVQYICLATDEDVARTAVAELVGPGYVHLQELPVTLMSQDCTVVDLNNH